jgi:hypothetical protein
VSSDCLLCLFRGWDEDVLVARSLYAGVTINNSDPGLIYEGGQPFLETASFRRIDCFLSSYKRVDRRDSIRSALFAYRKLPSTTILLQIRI